MTSELPPIKIISKLADLQALVETLRQEPLIAVDTESNSLFAYREQVCLIQLSSRTQDWIVDPLAIDDLSELGPIFADPKIEKVFHAAEYDLICMKRDFGFTFENLFDTMISARIIGRKAIGLANMLEEFFGIHADKRFQRADWSLRPIPREQLQYARQDTHYLPALRDILLNIMEEEGYMVEAREDFELLAQTESPPLTFDTEGYWRINAARDLNPRQMAILRELYLIRDQAASRRNRPPFKVMSDETLVEIVRANPQVLDDLIDLPGMSRGQIERYGATILQAVKRGRTAPIPPRPDLSPRLDMDTMARYDALHKWRKARAIERGVESDVIIPKEVLWTLARNVPQTLDQLDGIHGLGPWKREKYGQELLAVLAATDPHQNDNGKN